jgi:alpha-tubulin suppressor-like RCC1 family protein
MKKTLYILFFLPLLSIAQKQATGTVIGNQVVRPIAIAPTGYALGESLVYYPDDYFKAGNETKRYPLYVFLHGAGEGNSDNITEVTNTSLPNLIKNGLKPYGIDPNTGDTIKWIVVSPHCAVCGGSFSFPQLQYSVPYLFANYRVDTSCVWFGGLSSGGRGTWSMVMGNAGAPNYLDTNMTKRITGIMPMANGGYDLAINDPTNKGILDTTLARGLRVLYVIGDQDPGYNAIGYHTYAKQDSVYGIPGYWYHKVIIGGTHSTNVWNTPFPLTARNWSTTMNSWTQMWYLRRTIPVVALSANAGTPQTITLPTSTTTLSGSGTTPSGTTITGYSWSRISGPNTPTITGGSTATASLSGLIQGTYVYQLTVTNSASNTATSTVTITVNAAPPATPPTASAGSNQSLAYGTTATSLVGTGSAAASGNTLTGYLWAKVSGATVTITNSTSATATVTGLTTGSYIFSLRVTDNNGSTDTAQVLVTVAAQGYAPNIVKEVGCTEYKAGWMYSDGSVRTFTYNNTTGHVEFAPLLIGGRSAVHISTGFNRLTVLDDQGYVWLSDMGLSTCKRFDTDTTGAAGNGFVSIYGYFYTYIGIRSDGTIWYAGGDDFKWYQPLVNPLGKWVKINQPAGVKFVKIAAGNCLLGLTNTGDVYEWDKGNTAYRKVNLPKPATDITNSQSLFNFAVIPDDTAVSKAGWPYAWGAGSKYWGGNGNSYSDANPQAIKTLWGITKPIKRIAASMNMVHFIDTSGALWAMGDNVQGQGGNGEDTVLKAGYATPLKWCWCGPQNYMTSPVIIKPGTKFKELFTSNSFVFYDYGIDENDSLYFWGRNKSFVGGDGAVNGDEGNTPNSLDVTVPTLRTPISITPLMTTSYKDSLGAMNPGINQTISGSSTTLSAFARPHQLIAAGKPNYGYTIVSYHWEQISGQTTAVFGNADAQSTGVSNLQPGIPYVFRCTSTDTQGGTLSATMMVVVNAGPTPCAGCRIRKTFITTKVIKQ